MIKESSVHFRKKEGKGKKKKHVFPPRRVLWFIRTDRPRKTGENRGRVEPPDGDAIANAVSPSDCVTCTNNHFFPNIYGKKKKKVISFLSWFLEIVRRLISSLWSESTWICFGKALVWVGQAWRNVTRPIGRRSRGKRGGGATAEVSLRYAQVATES